MKFILKKYCPALLLLGSSIVWLNIPNGNGRIPIPTYDSVFFLQLAHNLLNFGELGWQGYFEPFFYSLVTVAFSFFSDELLSAGLLVSKTSVLFLVLTTYLLGKEIYGKKVGFISAIFVIFMPHLYAIANSPQSEALYSLLLTLSLYLLWLTYKKKSFFIGAISGLSFAAAYLTRSEGIFILFFLVSGLVILEIRKKIIDKKLIIALLITCSVFTATSSPYFLYLKNHYGTWTLGTKTASVYFWVRSRCFKDPDPEKTEWGLSPKGELNMISLTSKEFISYWLKDPPKSIKVYLENLKTEIPGFVPNSSGIAKYPQVYPLYFAIPLAIGMLIRKKKGVPMDGDFYLLSPFLILFIYPLLTSGWWRYLVGYSPLFMVMAANGYSEINDYFLKKVQFKNNARKDFNQNIYIWTAVIIISIYHTWVVVGKELPEDTKRYVDKKYELAMESKKAGLWAQKYLSPKSNYMVSWSRLVYYLGGKWTAMPETDFSNMLWYAKKNKVDYIVYEGLNRQQLMDMEKSLNGMPDLKLATVYKSSTFDYNVVFVEIL